MLKDDIEEIVWRFNSYLEDGDAEMTVDEMMVILGLDEVVSYESKT